MLSKIVNYIFIELYIHLVMHIYTYYNYRHMKVFNSTLMIEGHYSNCRTYFEFRYTKHLIEMNKNLHNETIYMHYSKSTECNRM